ncbi:MAG TPA: histidine kinase [Paraburkholderia sp.]|nr:histidine kinase [Paraburkholderia sp.]
MTRRVSLDTETEFALWKRGAAADVKRARRVLIGHSDRAIGESLVLLLSLKGYDAVCATDLPKVKSFLKTWQPHAILFDTRLDAVSGFRFVRALHGEPSRGEILVLAMSNILPLDPIANLKEAGFDGHCRRPCSSWRVLDILEGYFARA